MADATRRPVRGDASEPLGPNATIAIASSDEIAAGASCTAQHVVSDLFQPFRFSVDPVFARSWVIHYVSLGNLVLLRGPIGGASLPPLPREQPSFDADEKALRDALTALGWDAAMRWFRNLAASRTAVPGQTFVVLAQNIAPEPRPLRCTIVGYTPQR